MLQDAVAIIAAVSQEDLEFQSLAVTNARKIVFDALPRVY
jgi:hypothetical protein